MKDDELYKWKFDAQRAAKALGATALYDRIYDFSSNHVHPRYGDGYHDLGYEDAEEEHDEWRRLSLPGSNCDDSRMQVDHGRTG